MDGLAYGLLFGCGILVVGTAYIAFAWWRGRQQPPLVRLRQSARVFLFDPSGDVLLIRFVAKREDGPFVFWVTPGGEIEAGEEPRAAAERELFEELGLRVPLLGPVHEESGGTYVHLGETVENFDVFFAALCEREAPRLAGVTVEAIALMQEAKWWTLEELRGTAERVFPERIVAIVEAMRGRGEVPIPAR